MGLKWAELGLINQVGRVSTHIFKGAFYESSEIAHIFTHVFDQVRKDFLKTTFCSKLGQLTCN
jgi:hypothetical protein